MNICGKEFNNITEYVQYIIDTVCSELDIDKIFFKVEETKEGCSAWILEPMDLEKQKLSDRAFNIIFKDYKTKPKIFDVEIKALRALEPPENVTIKVKKNEYKKHTATIYHFPINSDSLTDFLLQVFKNAVENYKPRDLFGCCSKYLECSNEKHCLHEGSYYHKVCCYYRKNLEAGRIFYGANRNVD